MNKKIYLAAMLAMPTFTACPDQHNPLITQDMVAGLVKHADQRKQEIDEIVKLVDTTIQIKMNEFKRYFDMLKRAEDNWNREREFFHKQLGEIYGSLKSVDERVRRMYPDYNAKFDELNKLAEKKPA